MRGGEITEKLYRLIRPTPNWYSEYNTRIHGLTYHDTIEAPSFPEVWAELAPHIDGLPLVAHFSRFDEGCLRAAFSAYRMQYPAAYRFHCTCEAARRTFGRTLPNHKLPTVAARCGYDLSNHHHAIADAEACAHIAIHIL